MYRLPTIAWIVIAIFVGSIFVAMFIKSQNPILGNCALWLAILLPLGVSITVYKIFDLFGGFAFVVALAAGVATFIACSTLCNVVNSSLSR